MGAKEGKVGAMEADLYVNTATGMGNANLGGSSYGGRNKTPSAQFSPRGNSKRGEISDTCALHCCTGLPNYCTYICAFQTYGRSMLQHDVRIVGYMPCNYIFSTVPRYLLRCIPRELYGTSVLHVTKVHYLLCNNYSSRYLYLNYQQ